MKVLSSKEERALTTEEQILYYKELKEFLKNSKYIGNNDIGIAVKEKLNVLIKKILDVILKYDIKVDGYENIPDGPIIYASSHQDFHDIINSIYAYPDYVLTLNASNISSILKALLSLNGVIYVNRDDKKSRNMTKIEMEKALSKGKSINMYPEATLNCTPSKLHLPFYIGMIDMAKKLQVPIVPVVQEYDYDQSKLDGKSHVKSVHIRFAEPVFVSYRDDPIEKLGEYDEKFSTLRWELIEEKGLFEKKDISNKLYTDYIRARIRDWKIPNNDILEERKQVYLSDDDFYLFHHVNDVEFNENDELLPTAHVRKLEKINKTKLYK